MSRRPPARSVWKNLRVLITAGPTREHLDPIRYLTNASSGRMGWALASAASRLGARVTLILGPVERPMKKGFPIEIVDVTTADEMLRAVRSRSTRADVLIGAAAVGDWRFKTRASRKIKRNSRSLTVTLVPNADIIADAAARRPRPKVVAGFALETSRLVENARKKLAKKKLDLIVANGAEALGARGSKAVLIDRTGGIKALGARSKEKTAEAILRSIAELLP